MSRLVSPWVGLNVTKLTKLPWAKTPAAWKLKTRNARSTRRPIVLSRDVQGGLREERVCDWEKGREKDSVPQFALRGVF